VCGMLQLPLCRSRRGVRYGDTSTMRTITVANGMPDGGFMG
jgi:hypothetical protein